VVAIASTSFLTCTNPRMFIALRLWGTVKKDANVKALVNFDCFAQVVQFAMDDLLREIKPYFAAYLQDNGQPAVKHYGFYSLRFNENDVTDAIWLPSFELIKNTLCCFKRVA
jgi:hypothetical protein